MSDKLSWLSGRAHFRHYQCRQHGEILIIKALRDMAREAAPLRYRNIKQQNGAGYARLRIDDRLSMKMRDGRIESADADAAHLINDADAPTSAFSDFYSHHRFRHRNIAIAAYIGRASNAHALMMTAASK